MLPPKHSPPPFPPLLSNSPLHSPAEQHFGCPPPSTIHSFDSITPPLFPMGTTACDALVRAMGQDDTPLPAFGQPRPTAEFASPSVSPFPVSHPLLPGPCMTSLGD